MYICGTDKAKLVSVSYYNKKSQKTPIVLQLMPHVFVFAGMEQSEPSAAYICSSCVSASPLWPTAEDVRLSGAGQRRESREGARHADSWYW